MKKEKNKKEIILDACLNLEFVSGLKQFRDYSKEDKQRLIDCLFESCKSFVWLTNKRLEYILYNGIRGNYGDFYGLNERTLTQWINKYYESHKQQILIEINPKQTDQEINQEEKNYWIELGRKRFIKNWEKSKSGQVPDLDEWAPYWYNKMIEKKVLVPERYNPEGVSVEQKKMLRLDRPFFGESDLRSAIRNKIWKLFIRECIQKGPDLSKLV
jgi:transposase-like protein